jgi:hypothetical protein
MKKLFVLIGAAMLTTGCSQLLYPGAYGPGRYGPGMAAPYGALRPAPLVEATPTGRWDNVMRLPRTSTIDVLTTDGVATVGAITGADVGHVRLLVQGTDVTISRRDIIRVDLVDVAGSDAAAVVKQGAKGALVGAAIATVASAVIGGRAWPPPGPLLRGGAALGAMSGGESELIRRRQRIIYLAPEQMRLPSGGNSEARTPR